MDKLWKKSALPSVEDIAKEISVRKNLTSELTKSIHAVQEQSLEKSVLTDDEFTASLCNVLEAIFIHGLKDKFIRKMSAVFGSNPEKIPEPQFWTAVCKFSHKNVILEINSFNEVISDVGRGRSWLRAAINDGLIASYVSNMLSDKSGLQKHYTNSAYLRDEEQSDLMKSLLEGLTEVKFELSCNNSSLNIWHSMPLTLADIWTPPVTPQPVMPAVDVIDFFTDPKNQTKSSPKTKKTSVESVQTSSPNEDLSNPKSDSQPSSDDKPSEKLIHSEDSTIQLKTENEEKTEANRPVLLPEENNVNSVISGFESIEKSSDQNSEEVSSKVSSSDSIPDFGIEIIDDFSEPFGNKLSEHSGWSSSFDCDKDSGNGEANQSYDSLLQSYNKNLSKVVIGTPDLADAFANAMKSKDDDCSCSPDAKSPVDGFEVVPTFYTANHADEETKKLRDVVGKLCPEKGLSAQDFKCNSCGCPIGIIYGKSRLCYYDGYHYCYECHENDLEFIPARMMHNWDFNKYPISKRAKIILSLIETDPILDMKLLNPAIYTVVEEMAQMQLLRTQLTFLYAYICTCNTEVLNELTKRIWPREYLCEHIHSYCITDLIEVASGVLQQFLVKQVAFAKKHVLNCSSCRVKGFICEKCKNSTLIFPFEVETTYQCGRCHELFHNTCMNASMSCPKCERIRKRQQLLEAESESVD